MLSFLSSYHVWGLWILQIVVGLIFIVHSSFKLKSGGNFFKIGGKAHGLVEIVGGIALILNFHVRAVALVFAVIMLGAIWFKMFKWQVPFMAHDKTGWEFDLILLAANIFLMVR
jgi:uncharacterized membrane protein YphA (DoxX/SURF4 family)